MKNGRFNTDSKTDCKYLIETRIMYTFTFRKIEDKEKVQWAVSVWLI